MTAREVTPVAVWVSTAIAAIVVLVCNPAYSNSFAWIVQVGLLYGLLWASFTAAAVWFALRSASFGIRARDALLWCGVMLVIRAIRTEFDPQTAIDFIVLGSCLTAQWLALQPPLLLLRSYGYRLTRDAAPEVAGPWQFGMRELLLITAAVGVLLGVGRWVVQSDFLKPAPLAIIPLYVVLTSGATLSTAPLLIAVLLRRRFVIALILALLLGGGALAAEIAWILQSAPVWKPIVASHIVQVAWTILLGGIFRGYGYRLVRPKNSVSAADSSIGRST